MPPRIMPLVLGEARESWRCPTGGAEHTRSSLLMALERTQLGLEPLRRLVQPRLVRRLRRLQQ